MEPTIETADTYAVIEQMGHRAFAGRVQECKRFGAEGVLIDVPAVDGAPAWQTFVAGSSLFNATPCTREQALSYLRRNFVRPPEYLGLPAPARPPIQAALEEADDERDIWDEAVSHELREILADPDAALECAGLHLVWLDDAQVYAVGRAGDTLATTDDLLAALRLMRAPGQDWR